MNHAQKFTVNLLKRKIEYYKFMVGSLRDIEERRVYENLLKSYKEVLANYLGGVK